MIETVKPKWPYPPGHRRHGEPKPPSMAAVWRMLESDYGIKPPSISEKIKNGEPIEVGDYDSNKQAFPVWLHVPGAAYPEKYWHEVQPPACQPRDVVSSDEDEPELQRERQCA